jgi:hypothetical protein
VRRTTTRAATPKRKKGARVCVKLEEILQSGKGEEKEIKVVVEEDSRINRSFFFFLLLRPPEDLSTHNTYAPFGRPPPQPLYSSPLFFS